MNVCSLELSKQLYELSGWVSYDYCYYDKHSTKHSEECSGEEDPYASGTYYAPAYSLGFILRKLPRRFTIAFDLFDDKTVIDVYYGQDDQDGIHKIEADTPENCAARLAILLFEQGILKRKGEK